MIEWLAGVAAQTFGIGFGIAMAQWLDNRVFRNNRIIYQWEGSGEPPQKSGATSPQGDR
jgi:hypothetical protein